MKTWLDYKPSPRRLSICLSQREQKNIVAQSVTPKYHHWASCFLFLVKMLKGFELTLFFQHTDWPLEWTTNHHQALNILVPQCTLAQFSLLWHNLSLQNIITRWVVFYFYFQCQKVLNLLCFFSTQIDHMNGLQTIIKL